jgi:hypothetical protein
MYTKKDYRDAINFALNYPPDFDLVKHDLIKDLYRVYVFDGGWYDINLCGYYVRSCLKWKGIKKWDHGQTMENVKDVKSKLP